MYDDTVQNGCQSEDFLIKSSTASLRDASLTIQYDEMKPSKLGGQEPIQFVCKGFKNPIQKERWEGFHITLYDSEDVPNEIQITEDGLAIDGS